MVRFHALLCCFHALFILFSGRVRTVLYCVYIVLYRSVLFYTVLYCFILFGAVFVCCFCVLFFGAVFCVLFLRAVFVLKHDGC